METTDHNLNNNKTDNKYISDNIETQKAIEKCKEKIQTQQREIDNLEEIIILMERKIEKLEELLMIRRMQDKDSQKQQENKRRETLQHG